MDYDLRKGIENCINLACAENKSNTPDYILAEYLIDCLNAFDSATKKREGWYGVYLKPGHNYKKIVIFKPR